MAVLHPDPPRIPPELASEREVLAALRTLPPEAHVFARLRILDAEANRDRELDFLVLHPDLGLVIVEVKGRGVEPKGDQWIRRDGFGREQVMDETPGEQLQAQQYALLRYLKDADIGFIPQVTRVLALPCLSLSEDEGLGPDLPACRILTREKLKGPFLALRSAVTGGTPWEAWKGSAQANHHHIRPDVLRRLLEALSPRLLPPPSLSELLASEGCLQDEQAQGLLDHLAQNFSQSRYHVYGAPGSGKSLLARKVTHLWAAEGRKVLVVAFNRALTYATQTALDALIREDRVFVTTFHDLAASLLNEIDRMPECIEKPIFFNQDLPKAFSAAIPELRHRWDALVVDEAQDLDPTWVAPLLGLLRNPDQDPVLLLEDPAQCLYREGHHELGQPWRLDLSLRQNAAIRRAACLAMPACDWAVPDVVPDDGSVLMERSSPETWKRDLARHLETLQREGLEPSQILILAPHRPDTLGVKDGQMLGPWCINAVPDWWEEDKADQVRFGTVHGFKGLEADAVIYLAPAYRHPDAQRLAYTAYSRARHRLIVLEKALAQPVRPKAPEPEVEKAPLPPVVPQVRTFSEGQRQNLMGALTAAHNWKPGQKPKALPAANPTCENVLEEAP